MSIEKQVFDPDGGASSRVIETLRISLARRNGGGELRLALPRRDQIWIDRADDEYSLTLRRDQERFRLKAFALSQLCSLLEVPLPLLTRLRSIQGAKDEDTALLNKLIWHFGGDGETGIQIRIRGAEVIGVVSTEYRSIHLPSLLHSIEQSERTGRLKLVRFALSEHAGIRLVFEHAHLAPIEMHRTKSGATILWRPGAVLTNREDGAHAVTVAPALVSQGGLQALPVVRSKDAVHRHHHRGVETASLVSNLMESVHATSAAAFDEFAKRFLSLRRLRVSATDVPAVLGEMNLPLGSRELRADIEAACMRYDTNQYWIVHSILRAIDALDPADRNRVEIALGRLVRLRGIVQS